MRLLVALSILACLAAPADARGQVLFAHGSWAAIDRGTSCEAVARSARVAARGKVQAIAGFTFTPDRRRWGEFNTRLRRLPRSGASVMLRVGDRPFLLVLSGDSAWSSGPAQELAIIGALRDAAMISVESRDRAGRRFVDYYPMPGAATAIDAAAARCALRGAGKIE